MSPENEDRAKLGAMRGPDSIAPSTAPVNGACECETCALSRLVAKLSVSLRAMTEERDALVLRLAKWEGEAL